jgi:tRNA threonylcarbamoyladenosine biosynthesis protein TsaB
MAGILPHLGTIKHIALAHPKSKMMNGNESLHSGITLAVETATPVCAIALWKGETLVFEETLREPGRHAEMLPVMTKRALEKAEIRAGDITSVIFDAGPGSYTGLRIGLSFLKGLLFETPVRAYAPGTLAHMAFFAAKLQSAKGIHAILDARRNHVYHQYFKMVNGVCSAEGSPEIRELQDVAARVNPGEMLCGSGTTRFEKLVPADQHLDLLPVFSAVEMRAAVMHFLDSGSVHVVDLETFEPDYLGSPV